MSSSRRDRIRKNYYNKQYPILSKKYDITRNNTNEDCVNLNKLIQNLNIIISDETKKQLGDGKRSSAKGTIELRHYLTILKQVRTERETEFTTNNCSSKLNDKIIAVGKEVLEGEMSDYEADIHEDTSTNIYVFVGIGTLVMLGAILIIAKNRK